VALTVALLGAGAVQTASAQDDTIVLSAGGSELVVTPGGEVQANSAVAEAHAAPGFAETIASGARAVADSDCGAFTEASAASAVAIPDAGAATEAEGGAELGENGIGLDDGSVDESLAVSDPAAFAEQLQAQIMSENEALQMIQGGDDDSAGGPVRAEANNQKDGREISIAAVERCIEENDKEAPPVYAPPVYEAPAPEVPVVYEVPSTGSGAAASPLSALLAAAAAAAAFGAVALRKQDEQGQVVIATIGR